MTRSKISWVITLIATLSLAAPGQTAHAIIVDHTTYTTDTATGLDWLDVTASTNLTYDYVSSQFGAAGQFEGWRYATVAELTTLLLDYGINAVPHSDTASPAMQDQLHLHIISQLGQTQTITSAGFGVLIVATYGRLACISSNCENSVAAGIEYYLSSSTHSAFGTTISFGETRDFDPIGSFLVRSVGGETPLPAALPLFAGGLGALGLLGWRRKKKAVALAA